MIDTQKLIRKLDNLYGTGKGTEVCMTVLPSVLADFQKMLKASPCGTPVTEEYRLEDGKGSLLLTGCRRPSGDTDIEADLIRRQGQGQ